MDMAKTRMNALEREQIERNAKQLERWARLIKVGRHGRKQVVGEMEILANEKRLVLGRDAK